MKRIRWREDADRNGFFYSVCLKLLCLYHFDRHLEDCFTKVKTSTKKTLVVKYRKKIKSAFIRVFAPANPHNPCPITLNDLYYFLLKARKRFIKSAASLAIIPETTVVFGCNFVPIVIKPRCSSRAPKTIFVI